MQPSEEIAVLECTRCGTLAVPPQYVCPTCRNTRFVESSLPGRGQIYSYTTIYAAPEAFQDQAPYIIALVDLKPGLRITARILPDEAKEIQIGADLILEKIDGNGYWFRMAP